MPTIQLRISPLADSHVVRWKGLCGLIRKGDAINDLLERVDVEQLLAEKGRVEASFTPAYASRLTSEALAIRKMQPKQLVAPQRSAATQENAQKEVRK